MNTPPIQLAIDRLDLAYQKLSGRAFRASGVVTGREQGWQQFIAAGYGIPELETTLLWIKRGILAGKRHEAALGFRRLIMDLGVFEDEHSAAVAEKRNLKPSPTPRDRALASLRPSVAASKAPESTKTAGEAAKRALDDLRAWKTEFFKK